MGKEYKLKFPFRKPFQIEGRTYFVAGGGTLLKKRIRIKTNLKFNVMSLAFPSH